MEKVSLIDILKKIPFVLIIVIIALLSVVKLTPYTTDPANHTQSIEQLDEEIESVLLLSAGATGVSAAISLLPGDACTPISEQFADLVKYFLIVVIMKVIIVSKRKYKTFWANNIIFVLFSVFIISKHPCNSFSTFSTPGSCSLSSIII